MAVVIRLIIDLPLLTDCLVWFIREQVLSGNNFVSFYIHRISCESVCKSLGADIVAESLIVESFPLICNDVFIESFKKT